MKKIPIVFLLMILSLVGCSTIPRNGSILNQQVSDGIIRNQIEVEKIIKALADVERAILDKEWDSLYVKIENAYIAKHSVADGASLTQDQRKSIAANASKVYFGLLHKISDVEKSLISKTNANSKILIEINDEVSRYLLSIQELAEAKININNKLSNMTGVDLSNISGIAHNLVGGI
ncbi:hypothetical protein [Marinobacter xiaoshiensis]|uniref:Lipoprotein n=1 Tax=Marinobacter xiaoshiensis TaxID=3073652 RepID=A0ABU2HGA3_9GAMM|nr:hypothetical protein [Marinobacter sp. F60267]MDS1310086.1 hypothetical protein [Marinobacter sp. F60267]